MAFSVAEKVDKHFSTYPLHSYSKGQTLIFPGDNPGHIFYLIKGKIREYDVSYKGDDIIINIFKPPSFFPMSYAINRKTIEYSYKTEEETVLRAVPVDDALAFVKDNPDVLLDLLSRIYLGMDGLLGRIVHLMAGTAKSRLIYELIIECRRFGKRQPKGNYILALKETDLAARSGLSRETVNREIQKLKDRGLVQISSQGILITDLETLEISLGAEI